MPCETLPSDWEIGGFDEEFTHCFTGECRVNMLPILYQINRVITSGTDLAALLAMTLRVMCGRLRMTRGMIMLYDRDSQTIFISDSFGLTDEEKKRGIYAPGEGVTGKVVETGKTVIVPRLGESADFLDRTGAHGAKVRSNTAFVCVPILHAGRVLGTICAERVYLSQRLLQRDAEFLSMIALMIAPAAELHLVERLDKARLENENLRLRDALKQKFRPANIIGNSKPMQEVYQLVGKVAASRATVLILGESGVGKELVANAIHYNSASADGPFIKANCAALPENLAESELFGHEKGSFTGAVTTHKGRFEQADGGTIFLDEVGELSMTMQAKLLRVLQEKTFERVGGSKPVKVDVRIITATNRDLAAMVAEGSFREDLYYRLNVFPITLPPLRERGADVVTLADHFVTRFAAENGKGEMRISSAALDMMMRYPWPGNVRELENVIERAVILADQDVIHGYDLPPSLQLPKPGDESGTEGGLETKIRAVEYELIVDALRNNNGNIGEAARELGLTRRMLSLRMERNGVSYKSFRTPGGLRRE